LDRAPQDQCVSYGGRVKLEQTYLWIDDDGTATPVEAGPDFWPNLISGQTMPAGRWLLGASPRTPVGLPQWDVHPEGECISVLLDGAVDVVQRISDGERTVSLRRPGDTCCTPRGVAHRSIVQEPGRWLFFVAGDGTRIEQLE
jgi:hypothetical protein